MIISPEFEQAVALLAAGVAEQAVPLLEAEAERHPRSWEVLHALGRAVDLTGDQARAEKLFEEAHRQAPSEPEPACDLAMLHLAREDDTRAEEILAPSVAAHPDHPRANLFMAMALAKTSASRALNHAGKVTGAADPDLQAQAKALYTILAKHVR